MRGKRRRRNQQRNDDTEDSEQGRGSSAQRKRRFQNQRSGSHMVTGYTNRSGQVHHKQKNHQPHSERNRPFGNSGAPTDHPNHDLCRLSNKHFKSYLMDSLEESRRQIELWCPDDFDEMDWQPEKEILVITPPVPAAGLECRYGNVNNALEQASHGSENENQNWAWSQDNFGLSGQCANMNPQPQCEAPWEKAPSNSDCSSSTVVPIGITWPRVDPFSGVTPFRPIAVPAALREGSMDSGSGVFEVRN